MDPARESYGRLGYRQMIAWKERLEREGPALREWLQPAPERSLLDLGCGTGEHAAHFARDGWRVLGVDHSAEQIEAAGSHREPGSDLEFLHCSFRELDTRLASEERFGAALCLGNVLPSLHDEELEHSLASIRRRLLPGAPLLLQILNFERILRRNVRHLPLSFRPAPDGDELLFLRLLRPEPPHHVLFQPLRLRLGRGPSPTVNLEHAEQIRWRAWTLGQLLPLFTGAGFEEVARHGDMGGRPYDSASSHDLVLRLRVHA